MVNTIHFPFPTKGEIFISPKTVIEEKIAKKQAETVAPETLAVTPFELGSWISTREQVIQAMQVQSKAFDMLKLKMARKQLLQVEEEQKMLPMAVSS